jgi:hypothetical protein
MKRSVSSGPSRKEGDLWAGGLSSSQTLPRLLLGLTWAQLGSSSARPRQVLAHPQLMITKSLQTFSVHSWCPTNIIWKVTGRVINKRLLFFGPWKRAKRPSPKRRPISASTSSYRSEKRSAGRLSRRRKWASTGWKHNFYWILWRETAGNVGETPHIGVRGSRIIDDDARQRQFGGWCLGWYNFCPLMSIKL